MKGLMIKDFIAIAANGRTLIFIVAIFMAMAMISGMKKHNRPSQAKRMLKKPRIK